MSFIPITRTSSTGNKAHPARRARDYTRTFKACDTCRKKKTRCILDAPEASRAACRKCKRERKECSLSKAASSGGMLAKEPSNGLACSEPEDSIMGMSYLPCLTRIIFGQEKKFKALMLTTEWAPRAVYFPPRSDGWDSDLIFQLPDDRDHPSGNAADVAQDINGTWFRDVIAPARRIDRMAWMLLGCAVTLGHEIGIFDATKAKLAVAGLGSPETTRISDWRIR